MFIENDANAGVCAQQWFSSKSEGENMIYIVAGQGIGCGIISNGELHRGSVGSAGEIGHTSINYMGPKCECGNRGCLEKYASSIAIMEHVKEKIQNGAETSLTLESDFDAFAEAVRQGDALAVDEFRNACECLAVGIVNLVNQVNPREIIIGDVLADVAPEVMLEIVRERVKERTSKFVNEYLSIEHNQIQHNPILIGAGAIAAQKVLEDPIGYIEPHENAAN